MTKLFGMPGPMEPQIQMMTPMGDHQVVALIAAHLKVELGYSRAEDAVTNAIDLYAETIAQMQNHAVDKLVKAKLEKPCPTF